MAKLTAEQELIVSTVRQFVDKEVMPVASALEHRNEYPHALVEQMRKIGLFGLNVAEEYGGADTDFTTFAMIFEELARGWLGLAGVIGTHSVLCDVLTRFATKEQKQRFLPGLASGERRGGICLSEPNAGTDLQGITTVATRHGDGYQINGSKMWVTNGRYGNTFLLLAKTDPQAQPAHSGMSAFVIEKGAPGLTVSRDIDKLGYKSVETCELHFQDFPVPAANLIGGVEGHGFKQVMTGLEAERLNVAARGLGIARAAFEEAIRYAQRRTTFGKPISEHQTIQIKLADMATRIEASRLLIYSAAEKRDRGERCDLEAGMAKLFATETAAEVSFEAMRILGGNGYSKDFPVERYYRDAPLVVIGGGTNELQRLIIARNLLKKYPGMTFGRYYDEFELGAVYRHWPGRTISDHDNTWFALLSMNQHPLFIDDHYAAKQPAGRRPVIDTLVFSLTVGMSVADTSGKTIANLGYESVVFERPLFPGDSLYAESEVLELRESASKPDRGIVAIETRGFNQERERIIVLRRRFLAPKRGASQ